MTHLLKIATVDDMPAERETLAKKIKKYLDIRWINYELFEFQNGEAFVAALKKENFDIVFMDIYMEGMTGMEAADKLRENSMDCKLVFITSSREFLEEGYGYNPCHYLLKPFDDKKFEKAMHNCQIKRQLTVPFLDVVFEGNSLRIDTGKLLYIDICNRSTTLHMKDYNLSVSGTMTSVMKPLLIDERFIKCIQGILVNMDFISDVDNDLFILKNGEKLPIRIRYKKSIIRQYHAYQFQRISGRGGTYL